ncbi:MAG: hypothetical protein KME35_23820 [Aphanocapsa sp. GSE-SYN-MK-11-07L]|jgi:hypothetical protein|nr:hypothetical protein [Aphanocapsa sp. GSE-SYN-MK-11-07L]
MTNLPTPIDLRIEEIHQFKRLMVLLFDAPLMVLLSLDLSQIPITATEERVDSAIVALLPQFGVIFFIALAGEFIAYYIIRQLKKAKSNSQN